MHKSRDAHRRESTNKSLQSNTDPNVLVRPRAPIRRSRDPAPHPTWELVAPWRKESSAPDLRPPAKDRPLRRRRTPSREPGTSQVEKKPAPRKVRKARCPPRACGVKKYVRIPGAALASRMVRLPSRHNLLNPASLAAPPGPPCRVVSNGKLPKRGTDVAFRTDSPPEFGKPVLNTFKANSHPL